MRTLLVFLVVLTAFPPKIQGFMWNLLGFGCNCCRCGTTAYNIPYSMSPPATWIPNSPPSLPPVMYSQENFGTMGPAAYRGPPSAYPTSREQLHLDEGVYEAPPEIAIVRTTVPPTPILEDDDHMIGELEKELAAEKYRYTEMLSRKTTIKPKTHLKQRIRVFKLHHVHKGKVDYQNPKYSKENAIAQFSLEGFSQKQGLEEFIPIKIGAKPENVDEEPAGPPPSVKNRVFSNPESIFSTNSILRRRFVT